MLTTGTFDRFCHMTILDCSYLHLSPWRQKSETVRLSVTMVWPVCCSASVTKNPLYDLVSVRKRKVIRSTSSND